LKKKKPFNLKVGSFFHWALLHSLWVMYQDHIIPTNKKFPIYPKFLILLLKFYIISLKKKTITSLKKNCFSISSSTVCLRHSAPPTFAVIKMHSANIATIYRL